MPHKKIGRNDMCMCGSGKKFKKCCEGKDSSTWELSVVDKPIGTVKNLTMTFTEKKEM
jgi:hypothetical protein